MKGSRAAAAVYSPMTIPANVHDMSNTRSSFLYNLMAMGSLLRMKLRTRLIYKRDPHVHCSGSLENQTEKTMDNEIEAGILPRNH